MAQDAALAQAIVAASQRLGIDPHHLATAISYETGGKFSPGIWGGKGGNHLGLIQFGAEERAKYGVRPDQSAVEQMGAVESFLRDRGVKPGMGLPDIYSTINAGSPGRYNASDANNGGAPGTVLDKVQNQMAGHARNARALLSGQAGMLSPAPAAVAGAPSVPQPVTSAAVPGTSPVAAPAQDDGSLQASLQGIGNLLAQSNPQPAPLELSPILPAQPAGPTPAMIRARQMAKAMLSRPLQPTVA